MSTVLHIVDPVVTGDRLKALHRDEKEVCISPQSVITPSAWDYIREWRLRVIREHGEPRRRIRLGFCGAGLLPAMRHPPVAAGGQTQCRLRGLQSRQERADGYGNRGAPHNGPDSGAARALTGAA